MPKRPCDTNQLAKMVVDMSTGDLRNDSHDAPSGRAKGGHARAAKLTAERGQEISRKAIAARWRDNGSA